MTRYKVHAVQSLNTRLAHSETCVTWDPPTAIMPAPPDRETLLRRKEELEAAAAVLALRAAIFGDAAAVAAFEEIRRDLAMLERDSAASNVCDRAMTAG